MNLEKQPLQFKSASVELLGARPYTCDFHLHAPPDWRGSTFNKPIEQFIEEDFLPAIFKSGRQVIGIPQHRNMADGGTKVIRDIARRLYSVGRKDIPVVFPGYELTSADQIQVIILANPDENDTKDLDVRVSECLRLQQNEWHESGHNLTELLSCVRDRFEDRLLTLVVATGHKGILEDKDTANRLRNTFATAAQLSDGFILSKPFSEIDDFAKRILSGECEKYISEPVPYLVTSDARTLEALSPTLLSHVKLGSFTVEGIRQALLNKRTFLSDKVIADPDWRILHVKIKNTVFFDDLQIDFNPHMTCLIGGRGTGKSCILEYLSHVCQYERASEYDRPNKGILWMRGEDKLEGTLLPTTEIELAVKGGQKFYLIKRIGKNPAEIYECADQRCLAGVPIGSRSPATLLNLRYFGQRELANIVRDESFFSLDPNRHTGMNLFSFLKSDQLSQIETKEREARQLTDSIEKISVDMATWAAELMQTSRVVSERDRLNEELQKIKMQASNPALQTHQDYGSLDSSRKDVFATLDAISNDLSNTIQGIQNNKRSFEKPITKTQTGIDDSINTLKSAALRQADSLVLSLTKLNESWQNDSSALSQSTENILVTEKLSAHTSEYEAAKKEMETNKINLTLLEPLQTRLSELDARISHFDELIEQLEKARNTRKALVDKLRLCRSAQGDIYISMAESLSASTNQRVRMKVVRAGDIGKAIIDFQSSLRDARKFNSRDAEQLDAAFKKEHISRGGSAQPAMLWVELVDYLLSYFEENQDSQLCKTSAKKESNDKCTWLGPTAGKIVELIKLFDDKQIGKLLCQYVPDSIEMELRRKIEADDYISIQQASVGQKATALFLILLAQTDGLLVIDQPEDDLDNAFITNDILPAIHELKHQQQIIFVTHNANILVNAESEKVVVLDTEPRVGPSTGLPQIRGHIYCEGGIDNSLVRNSVTGILEGGEEAFLAREKKYRFAVNR